MNTLPEILVKEHENAIKDMACVYAESPYVEKDAEKEAANDCAAITIAHIGKALEWAADEVNHFVLHNGRWIQSCGNSTSWSTTELVNKYFESLK